MKLNFFKSFDELADYFDDAIIQVEMSRRDTLRAIGIHLRKQIRDAYGHYGPGWAKSYSSPNSPLVKTGGLRNAVSFKTTKDSVEVYSKKEWLALIHEYGAVYKMSEKQRKFLFGVVFQDQPKLKGRARSTWGTGMVRIPARPIWRRVLDREEKNIGRIAEEKFVNIFK